MRPGPQWYFANHEVCFICILVLNVLVLMKPDFAALKTEALIGDNSILLSQSIRNMWSCVTHSFMKEICYVVLLLIRKENITYLRKQLTMLLSRDQCDCSRVFNVTALT